MLDRVSVIKMIFKQAGDRDRDRVQLLLSIGTLRMEDEFNRPKKRWNLLYLNR